MGFDRDTLWKKFEAEEIDTDTLFRYIRDKAYRHERKQYYLEQLDAVDEAIKSL